MTAKEFVKSKMPDARAERHSERIGVTIKSYWLIRNGTEFMWFVEGDTESKAWINAKNKIIEQDQIK